jgi:hypothetical protein
MIPTLLLPHRSPPATRIDNGREPVYRRFVHFTRRPWNALLGALIAIFLAAPATAWDMHALTHLSAPVAADEHHHHDEDGAVEAHQAPADQSDDGPDGRTGHDHMPSLTAAWTGVTSEGLALPAAQTELIPHFIHVGRPPPDAGSDPQIRPPRSV